MRRILLVLPLLLSSAETLPRSPWKKQASAGAAQNCTGCALCSEDNGCLACPQRLFLLMRRDGIRQHGVCVHTCPPGYFGARGLDLNRCTRCRSPSCESCFSRDFCMKCKERFYLHKGQCMRQCPPGTAARPGARECQGKRRTPPQPPAHRGHRGLMEPLPSEPCETGPQSSCSDESRGHQRGQGHPGPGATGDAADGCPELQQTRPRRARKRCPGGERVRG
ncbi:RSPO4 protein, partial [Eudromia elegans]|nr:RSPO4 protein [Eudromia elegans]